MKQGRQGRLSRHSAMEKKEINGIQCDPENYFSGCSGMSEHVTLPSLLTLTPNGKKENTTMTFNDDDIEKQRQHLIRSEGDQQ